MFSKLKKYFVKEERGQGLVQFAILFPLLFLMLNIVVDTWRVVDAKMLVQSAASECALYMVEKSDKPDTVSEYILKVMDSDFNGRLDKNKIKVSISNIGSEKKEYHTYHRNYYDDKGIPFVYKYNDKKIVIEYEVKLVMPLAKLAFGGDTVKVKSDFITRVGTK